MAFGAPNDEDEAGLRRLSAQLKARKLAVKLFLRHLKLWDRPERPPPPTSLRSIHYDPDIAGREQGDAA